MSISLPAIGSAGRAAGSAERAVRELPPPPQSDYSSFCLVCASWYFCQHLLTCPKCRADMFRWVANGDLRFFRGRTSLGRL
jgi:hypothetical protein